jgi:hypothetical protein
VAGEIFFYATTSNELIDKDNMMNGKQINTQMLAFVIAIVMVAGCAGWVLSGVIHEFGHKVAVLFFDGVITEFQPLVLAGAPHVAYIGSFTDIQRAIRSVSGRAWFI